jgi:hypothetical protein
MLHRLVIGLLALVIFAGGLLAAEGVFVRFDNHDYVVKVGDKEQTISHKHVKVVDAAGKEVALNNVGEVLKKDTKVELVEKDGKVVELKVKK